MHGRLERDVLRKNFQCLKAEFSLKQDSRRILFYPVQLFQYSWAWATFSKGNKPENWGFKQHCHQETALSCFTDYELTMTLGPWRMCFFNTQMSFISYWCQQIICSYPYKKHPGWCRTVQKLSVLFIFTGEAPGPVAWWHHRSASLPPHILRPNFPRRNITSSPSSNRVLDIGC